jgi:hypothetical protein
MKSLLSKIALLSLFVSSLVSVAPAGASGVAVTLNPASSSSSPQNVDIHWTGSGVYVTGTTIVITTNPVFTSITTGTGSFTIDIDGNGSANGVLTATSTNSATFTVTTSTVSASTTLSLLFAFSATAQNYSISVFTSNPADFGSALFYANGGNLVNVTANVPATLAFSIRNAADAANTNSCALGTLTTAATSTCDYRLRVETNASNGFTATIVGNHDLASGSATMTSATDNGNANAGTEGYGISSLTGATAGGRNGGTGAFDQPVTESSVVGTTFATDISPVPTTSAVTIISYPASFSVSSTPSLTGTSLVTHYANISGGTPAGNYSQTVTYIVTASY